MYLELDKFSPDVKIGLVSASRNCFPRELSERRAARLIGELETLGVKACVPEGRCAVIESKDDAFNAADSLKKSGCDAAVLYLGNFSPEIEDANFAKAFGGPIMLLAAAEESAQSIESARGDALCGLISASLAMANRGTLARAYIPANPLVGAKRGAEEILRFSRIVKILKGISNATIGLFGPRPRDFESCNYNVASLASIGVEVEEMGLFDLEAQIARVREAGAGSAKEALDEISSTEGVGDGSLAERLAVYERALLDLRESKRLSAAATQCWTRQEEFSKHVPCFINARLTQRGFPVACENDAYSAAAELMCQYASNDAATMLDINHTIPPEMLCNAPGIAPEDAIGLFHCGNVPAKFLNYPRVCHQLIMSRLMEPGKKPDVTRGTLEGAIKASDITLFQIHGAGDGLRAYICEGSFLDLNPGTFGSVGIAHVPGFMRFYRHCLLGRFHHHAAIAFSHCGNELFEALKLLGVSEIYVPSPLPYPGENPFK
ncbi:MAG: fucose isomerase [Verrucomicrobia bacterium]|nr:MAG: fucose isomerase [Verrucomicrobiota bacterium]